MTYTNDTSDDATPAKQSDVPGRQRNYTCAFSTTTQAVFRLPMDVKVCAVINNTNKDLSIYTTKFTGDAEDNLFTAGTSSLIDTVAAGATFPAVQGEEFNSFHFKAAAAADGSVKLRPGRWSGVGNGLGDIETRAITAASSS